MEEGILIRPARAVTLVLALAFALAGCTFLEAPERAPTGEDGGEGRSVIVPAPSSTCGDLRVEAPLELRAWTPTAIDAWFTSCEGAQNVTLQRSELCSAHGIRLFVEGAGTGGGRLALAHLRSALPLGAREIALCEDEPRPGAVVLPAASVRERSVWDGSVLAQELALLPLGNYTVVAEVEDTGGHLWSARAPVRLVEGRVPPYRGDDAGAALVLTLDPAVDASTASTDVVLRNDGNVSWELDPEPARCVLAYYADDGRPLSAPGGSRCRIFFRAPLEPGASIALAAWDLTVCDPRDADCLRPERIPSGRYHVLATLRDAAGAATTVGTSFTL